MILFESRRFVRDGIAASVFQKIVDWGVNFSFCESREAVRRSSM